MVSEIEQCLPLFLPFRGKDVPFFGSLRPKREGKALFSPHAPLSSPLWGKLSSFWPLRCFYEKQIEGYFLYFVLSFGLMDRLFKALYAPGDMFIM